MNNKIVFLVESPFNERDYDRFGIEILSNNGFDVYVWDFTPFIRPISYRSVKITDPCIYKKLRQFYTFEDAKTSLLELDKCTTIICLIMYRFDSKNIYQVLGKSKIKYGTVVSNALPQPLKSINYLSRNNFNLNVRRIAESLFIRMNFQCMGVRPAHFLLFAGGRCDIRSIQYPMNEETKIVSAHAIDYDIYLEERKETLCVEKGMGVFLDEYFPFHPDNLYRGMSTPVTPEIYYPQLCEFFDLLENTYKVKICIAAHPRSCYGDHPDYYKGRNVVRGETCSLIRKSEFVIAHSSTAISWAVLFNKPIIFITSNQIKCAHEGPFIERIAFLLKKKAINLDLIMNHEMNFNWNHEMTVNHKAYDEYHDVYIKSKGSPEKPFWQIVSDYFNCNYK